MNGPTSDIDTLVVAPRDIDRWKHFFGMLAPILRDTPGVTDLAEVKDTFVPVIKMKYRDVEIDMLFARIEFKEVGKDFDNPDSLLHDDILRNCDEMTIRSLNGCRVTDLILKTVGETTQQKETFETTLRCIKLWSKNRGIHSNVLGYLGGVAWAILVAKIVKDYPQALPNQVLAKFFSFYKDYDWRSDNPITLMEIANDPTRLCGLPENMLYKHSG